MPQNVTGMKANSSRRQYLHNADNRPSLLCVHNNVKQTLSVRYCLLPYMTIRMWHLDNTNTTTKPSVVHTTINLPAVLFWVIHLYCLEVCCAVKTTNGHQLAIDNGKTNL